MENLVTCRLAGGLGNWLFQISVCHYVKNLYGKTPLINTSDINTVHTPINKYMSNIFRKVEFTNSFRQDHYIDCGSRPLDYWNIPQVEGNLKLEGYFQHEDYLNPIREQILDLFEIDPKTELKLNEKYNFIKSENTCSIHVRRGNYLNLRHVFNILDMTYYKNCIDEFDIENTHFVIFSNDQEWCQQNFNFLPHKTFINDNEDFEDLYLMSMCKDNIIANSSFSWWGGWLNKNINKKVYYPSMWFQPTWYQPQHTGSVNWLKR